MTTYTLYLGMIDQYGETVSSLARIAVLQDTARTFGGYTAAETMGGFTDASGAHVTEPSLRIEVVTQVSPDAVNAWAERLRIKANQETVLLTSHVLTSAEFIGSAVGAPLSAVTHLTYL